MIAQAGSGEEAVELAQRLRPDMVLLDVAMPGMGGIAAAGKIVASAPEVRIMMLTISADREKGLMATLKAGAHGYVLKGVSAGELGAITRRVADGEAYVTPALAVELLTEFSHPHSPDPFSELTARENGALELLSQGLTNREIGERLHLAVRRIAACLRSVPASIGYNPSP